jgi:hypothetical protein
LNHLIEKERTEWEDERMKLKYCIYLQEQELTTIAVESKIKTEELVKVFCIETISLKSIVT